MRRYDNFSPHDFELFVGDLLGAELGLRFETFPRGADGGVDLRHVPRGRTRPHVVQCKHYFGSSFSSLLASAKTEADRLTRLRPKPLTYRFVTSKGLTAGNKRALSHALTPWIQHENDILGSQDLEAILDRHPDVERRQVKLWLTGGTQLAALLRAGTVHRSQSLLDEIERAMPRYVQGQIFADARDQLRDQHVLVIAGVPGIGKTTLARMLLADAVLDGYEPVEVSADVEEAWEILDDSVKQIFLYDDFLGRTALAERFAKNEDRRLIEFMRRAARRRSSLFVLTTREYILRQARQFYERLDQEDLDSSRFLLELPRYTSVDRARIFANHVYHSQHLTRAHRRALLADNAYLKVINHRNYNPRTIEWITGFSGRWDTPIEPDDYVGFALRTLEHPELIWKHGYEQEIDDHGRAMVLALVSLPRRVHLQPLETAFEALCRTRALSLANRAFRRTLSALDDSLVRTQMDLDQWGEMLTVADPHDPSVIDFVVDFLKASPEDARDVARASVFFEQASWLWTTIGSSASTELRGELRAALRRTYDAVSITKVTVPLGPNVFTYRAAGTQNFESRLLILLDAAREDTEFGEWWREAFRSRVSAWQQGQGEPESVLKLLAAVREDDGVDPDAAACAAKNALMTDSRLGGTRYAQSLEWLRQLRIMFPEAVSRDEWDQHVDDFELWLRESLVSTAEDMSDRSELRFIDHVAELLGVTIDDDVWEEAEQTVEYIEEQRDSELDPDPDYEPRPSEAHDRLAETREIEAIFAELAD